MNIQKMTLFTLLALAAGSISEVRRRQADGCPRAGRMGAAKIHRQGDPGRGGSLVAADRGGGGETR